MGVGGSNGPLESVWLDGVSINGLVHGLTEQIEMGLSLIRLFRAEWRDWTGLTVII